MRKIKMLVGVLLLLVSQAVPFARAEAPASAGLVGNITFLEGVSDIERNGRAPEFIREKEPVYINDIIRTKNYSKAEITFLDKSVVKLAPDSCVAIEEYRLDDKNKREHSRIKLTRGRMEAIVSKTGTPDTFLVESPNARGAVKGSDIFFSYLGGKTGIFVLEGAISVFNPAQPGTKIKVTKDNCVVVPFNEAPGETRFIRDAEIDYFKNSVQPAFIKKWIPSKDATRMNGVIVSVTGNVRIYKKGADNWREPKTNDTVSEGDKVQTEENSTIEIRMSNGNTVVLQPYTELSFTTLRHDPASGSYENTLTIKAGRLSAVVTKTKDQLAFQVQTPTAICGVRGTFMEVVVTPPAAQGAPASQPVQPVTQVFFEGGTGFVTSNLTNQTQEVGSGQNAVVDAIGNVSSPLETAPEQRSAMFQTWTSAQTMNNYSTADGATGMGSNTQQQPLPQAPVGSMQQMETVTSVNEEIQNVIDDTTVLNLDELTNTPVIQTIFSETLTITEGSVGIDSGTLSVNAFDNNTWSMFTSGTWYDAPEYSGVIGVFQSGDDIVSFVGDDPAGVDDSGHWVGTVSGVINKANQPIAIYGTASGTYSNPGGTTGTFEGTGSGTWSPCVE
ncbi:MAG: FecR domain-containing protein [Candidatus Omnitrophota bacterium]|jgi:hypothetical protein